MKHNNIHIIQIVEEEEEERKIENWFGKVMMENFPDLMRGKFTQVHEAERVPIKKIPKRQLQDTS